MNKACIVYANVKKHQFSIPGFVYIYTTNELRFCKTHLEKELLHSSSSKPVFGIRVPPLKTSTFLNILSIVLDNLEEFPKTFRKYQIGDLYDAMVFSLYMKEFINYTKYVTPNLCCESIDSNVALEKVMKDLDLDFWNTTGSWTDIDFIGKEEVDNEKFQQLFANVKRIVSQVLKEIDKDHDSQNVWYFPPNQRVNKLTDDILNDLIYSCIRSFNDPMLIYKNFPIYDNSRTVPVVIYLSYFCYKLSKFAISIATAATKKKG